MNRERELTTADLARTSEEFRGRGEDEIVARERDSELSMTDAAAPTPIASPQTSPQSRARDAAADSHADSGADSAQESVTRNVAGNIAGSVAANTPSLRTTRDARAALFADADAGQLRGRWTDVQSAFVDEPRAAVERADSLVAEVMKRLAEGFARERSTLEHQWDRGDNVTTEDLRVALQRYRSFFDRLLQA